MTNTFVSRLVNVTVPLFFQTQLEYRIQQWRTKTSPLHIQFKYTKELCPIIYTASTSIRSHPNVFITTKTVNVIYYHISLLEAQLNCMDDLLQSKTQWKYLINLVGQDYPLYENKEIVKALKGFLGYNIIESGELPKRQDTRVRYSYDFVKQFNGFEHSAYLPRSVRLKPQPPNNIAILKGSTFTSSTRKFCKYLLNDSLPKRLFSWLGDTLAPEESFYSSIQQVKGVPGGYHGNLSEWIMCAIHWETNEKTVKCYGK